MKSGAILLCPYITSDHPFAVLTSLYAETWVKKVAPSAHKSFTGSQPFIVSNVAKYFFAFSNAVFSFPRQPGYKQPPILKIFWLN